MTDDFGPGADHILFEFHDMPSVFICHADREQYRGFGIDDVCPGCGAELRRPPRFDDD